MDKKPGRAKGTNGFTAEQFLAAIPGSAGIVTTIAKRVGCSWNTAKKYIQKYATVNRAWLDEKEKILDLAETKLIEQISDGEMWAVKYYLATQGKKRGYTEKQEIAIDIDMGNLTDEQLERIARGENAITVLANKSAG